MSGVSLSRREREVFASLATAVVAPAGALPAVGATGTVPAFAALLERSPAVNRAGLRALLALIELAPLLQGRGARFSRLPATERTAFLTAAQRGGGVRGRLVHALVAVAKLSYYGEDPVMRALGYDPDAVVARGRELRRAEGRW